MPSVEELRETTDQERYDLVELEVYWALKWFSKKFDKKVKKAVNRGLNKVVYPGSMIFRKPLFPESIDAIIEELKRKDKFSEFDISGGFGKIVVKW